MGLPLTEFWRDKAYRASYYFRFRFGYRQRDCSACSGSGYYDNDRSPKCGACEGTGKEWYRGPKWSENAIVEHAPKLAELYDRIQKERQ